MLAEDQSAVEALVLYPEQVRNDILIVSAHPEGIAKLDSIWNMAGKAFLERVGDHPASTQQQVWELARQPGLLEALVVGGEKSEKEIQRILSEYPEALRASAMELGKKQFGLLGEVYEIKAAAQKAVERTIRDYPPEARKAFRNIVLLPEVIRILNENMKLTVLAGDAYREDPESFRKKGGELRLKVKQGNAKSLTSWQKSLAGNPKVLAELERSAGAFAREQGCETTDAGAETKKAPQSNWLGYPRWFKRHLQPVRPCRNYWGFYHGEEDTIVVFALPSYPYTEWHLRAYRHFSEYPNLTDQMLRHYESHSNVTSGFHMAVQTWLDKNRFKYPKFWLADDGGRADRLADLGRFEEDFERYNRENPGRPVNRLEFLEHKGEKYPGLIRIDRSARRYAAAKAAVDRTAAEGSTRIVLEQRTEGERLSEAMEYHAQYWHWTESNRAYSSGLPTRGGPRLD
jgi:hypothetical protein